MRTLCSALLLGLALGAAAPAQSLRSGAVSAELSGAVSSLRGAAPGTSPALRSAIPARWDSPLRTLRVDVDLQDVPLREALARLSSEWNLPVGLSAAARDRADHPVDLRLTHVTPRTVLQLLADEHDLEFLPIEGGVLLATTPQDAIRRTAVLCFYDVGTHLFAPTSFPGPELGLRPSGAEFEEPVREIPGQGWDPDQLIDVLRTAAGGDAVFDQEGVSIRLARTTLMVRHTPAVQRRILRALLQL